MRLIKTSIKKAHELYLDGVVHNYLLEQNCPPEKLDTVQRIDEERFFAEIKGDRKLMVEMIQQSYGLERTVRQLLRQGEDILYFRVGTDFYGFVVNNEKK